MVIATDTSYLFSLYGADSHTEFAKSWIESAEIPILITSLNRFELFNSLRFSESRNYAPPGRTTEVIANFENDQKHGLLVEKSSILDRILAEAETLSQTHTLIHGHRSFDVLHVAAALVMKATYFLTFDANQKKLAENEGLIVPF